MIEMHNIYPWYDDRLKVQFIFTVQGRCYYFEGLAGCDGLGKRCDGSAVGEDVIMLWRRLLARQFFLEIV